MNWSARILVCFAILIVANIVGENMAESSTPTPITQTYEWPVVWPPAAVDTKTVLPLKGVYVGDKFFVFQLVKPPSRKTITNSGVETTEYDGMTYFEAPYKIQIDPALSPELTKHVVAHELMHIYIHYNGALIIDTLHLTEDEWIELSVEGQLLFLQDPRNKDVVQYLMKK